MSKEIVTKKSRKWSQDKITSVFDRSFINNAVGIADQYSRQIMMKAAINVLAEDGDDCLEAVDDKILSLATSRSLLPKQHLPTKVTALIRIKQNSYVFCCPCGFRSFVSSSVRICPECGELHHYVDSNKNKSYLGTVIELNVRGSGYQAFLPFHSLTETDDRILYIEGIRRVEYFWNVDKLLTKVVMESFVFYKKTRKIYKMKRDGHESLIRTPNKIPIKFNDAVSNYLGILIQPRLNTAGGFIGIICRYSKMHWNDPEFGMHVRFYMNALTNKSEMARIRRKMDKHFLKQEI